MCEHVCELSRCRCCDVCDSFPLPSPLIHLALGAHKATHVLHHAQHREVHFSAEVHLLPHVLQRNLLRMAEADTNTIPATSEHPPLYILIYIHNVLVVTNTPYSVSEAGILDQEEMGL